MTLIVNLEFEYVRLITALDETQYRVTRSILTVWGWDTFHRLQSCYFCACPERAWSPSGSVESIELWDCLLILVNFPYKIRHNLVIWYSILTFSGNILLNILLTSSIPTKRQGKNNVSFICVPNPPVDPKNPESTPTSMLIRVKTGEDADELLEKLEELKAK